MLFLSSEISFGRHITQLCVVHKRMFTIVILKSRIKVKSFINLALTLTQSYNEQLMGLE